MDGVLSQGRCSRQGVCSLRIVGCFSSGVCKHSVFFELFCYHISITINLYPWVRFWYVWFVGEKCSACPIMNIYKVMFAKNEIISCNIASHSRELDGEYYSIHKGQLIHAIIKAESETQALEDAKQLTLTILQQS